jgi:membrane-associated phospholipid phosphatase
MFQQIESGWALDVLLWTQEFRHPVLTEIVYILDILGGNPAYFLLIPLLYWSVNRHMARRLLFVLMVAGGITTITKVLFARPRPTDAHPDVVWQMIETHSYAFPSGHVAVATALCMYLGFWLESKLWWVVATIYIALQSFSRLYSGTHYPHDVIAGLFIGVLSAGLIRAAMPHLSDLWNHKMPLWFQAGLIITFGVLIGLIAQGEITGLTASGAAFGGGLGVLLEEQRIKFVTDGSKRQRLLRYVLGMVLMGLSFTGLNMLTQDMPNLQFLPYAFVLFFVMALFPWLAIQLNLAERDPLAREDSSHKLDPA